MLKHFKIIETLLKKNNYGNLKAKMWDNGGGPNRNRPKPVLVVFTDLIRTESTKQKEMD